MYRKFAIAILALSLGACFTLTSTPASAQKDQAQHKAQGQSRGGGNAGAPRGGGGGSGQNAVAPRGGGGQAIGPRGGNRSVNQRTIRTVAPKNFRTVSPRAVRTVNQRAVRTVNQRAVRTVNQRTIRTGAPRTAKMRVVAPRVAQKAAQKVVSPSGANASVVTAGRFRSMPAHGAGRTVIRGNNFSVWRSGYRVRHGSSWRTFAALSALGAVAIGPSSYRAYAYVSAPQSYCEGLTEDGCQLIWQQVETLEGDVVNQCVAYCPWQ